MIQKGKEKRYCENCKRKTSHEFEIIEKIAHDYESFRCLVCGYGHWSSEREGGGTYSLFKEKRIKNGNK